MSAAALDIRTQVRSKMNSVGKQEEVPPTISPSLIKIVLAVSFITLIITAITYFAAAHFGEKFSKRGHTDHNRKVELKIGIDRLNVPANTIRFAPHRIPGEIRKLELYLHWPSLSGFTEALSTVFNAHVETADIVFLTLERRTMSFDMSGRIGPIYSRYFEGHGKTKNFGLVRQPLNASAGFIDEDLYFEAGSPYPYAARCVRETTSATTPFCIRDIHVGKDLMLTYRFHKRFLPQWIELDQAMRGYVRSLITNL